MNCPSCGAAVAGGQERCPACGAHVAPAVEGALAPDPSRHRPEPLREIPGLKKKERTWKDEVRERMHDRKRRRAGAGDLPLFREDGEDSPDDLEPSTVFEPPAPAVRPMAARTGRGVPREAGGIELGSDEADLPLSPLAPPITNAVPDLGLSEAADPGSSSGDRQAAHAAEARPRAATAGGPEWTLGAEAAPEVRPVERPAYSGERIQAASLDLVLLAALWTVVVYFASRAARVDLVGLAPAWPYLLAYLAFLGLTYAGYFTGTTGQTLGKIATGLRVVDAGGRPPGYLRAFLRAVLGSAGVLLAGAGLVPILLDPARRALHDRLLKTRVVKG